MEETVDELGDEVEAESKTDNDAADGGQEVESPTHANSQNPHFHGANFSIAMTRIFFAITREYTAITRIFFAIARE